METPHLPEVFPITPVAPPLLRTASQEALEAFNPVLPAQTVDGQLMVTVEPSVFDYIHRLLAVVERYRGDALALVPVLRRVATWGVLWPSWRRAASTAADVIEKVFG